MNTNMYQEMWDNDANRFSVSGRNGGEWTNPNADVLLDEQVRAAGRRDRDLATRPLFHYVNEDKLGTVETFRLFKKLLDNYVVNYRDPETVTSEEKIEIQEFLHAVFRTKPMSLAYDYVKTDLGFSITVQEFEDRVGKMWFEPFVNNYQGRSTHYCSGFEHVFVGEGKYQRRSGVAETKGEVSGYHSWVKFHLDESQGRVNFLGYKYGLNGAGPDNPNVVTLQMTWNHVDLNGNLRAQLFKKTGGFFVGPSPECELAMGTVALFESIKGMFPGERRRVSIGQGHYDLVLYQQVLQDGRRGEHIRSFYPVYMGDMTQPDVPMGGTVVVPVPTPHVNKGPMVVTYALPNPPGDDQTGEWVELKNVSAGLIDLNDWELRDRLARPRELEGSVEPGQSRRFTVPHDQDFAMRLSNKGGLITLHDENGTLVSAVSYGKTTENVVVEFDVG